MITKIPTVTVLLLSFALYSVLAEQQPGASGAGLKLQFSENQPVTVFVTGTVRDKQSGSPIANASVQAHIVVWKYQGPDLFEKCPYQATVTDANGQYQITFVTSLTSSGPMRDKDSLCVSASAPGYGTQPQNARPHVTAGYLIFTNFNFALEAGKRLTGVVVNPAGQPVGGALVRVQNSLNGDWNFFGSLGWTITEEDGSFQLWFGADAGEESPPWLCIVKPNVGTRFVYDLTAKEDLGTLALNPGGVVAGKVRDADGRPVAGCEVSIRRGPCDLVSSALSDPQGNYELHGIPGEPSIMEFYKKKNNRYDPTRAEVEVYARLKPDMHLKDAPHCKLTPKDGQTVVGPDLVVGGETGVSGTLLASKTALSLGGLLVRLDDKWENMVEADVAGRFNFPYVPAGKHTLTAYLPFNLRYDRGVGKTSINVESGKPLKNVQIQLADLAELHVQYLDAKGNPLPGITAGATWSKNGDGAWTEGTVTDNEGWAVLYLYPDSRQYIRGFDESGKLTAETVKEVNPRPAEVLEPLQIVMVPTVSISGRLLDAQRQPVAAKAVLVTVNLADGTATNRRLKTDAEGRFLLDGVTPSLLRLSFEVSEVEFSDPLGKPVEARPGQTEELGDIVLKDGLDKPRIIKDKNAHALEHPQEIRQAAQDLFDRIRTANYDDFLKKGADWTRFPIVGFYQTEKWFDFLVKWMSQSFKTNPITRVEIGEVFANPKKIHGQAGLPTVSYKLTLRDGSVLQGNLPFEYTFEGGKGYWFGLHGIDWHLQKTPTQ